MLKRLFPPSRGSSRRSRHRFGLILPPAPSLDTAVTDCCSHVSPFRFCICLNVIGYFILLPVCGIVAISYYAVIIIGWGPRLFHAGEVSSSSVLPFFIVVLFHLLIHSINGWMAHGISRLTSLCSNKYRKSALRSYSKLLLLIWSYFMVVFRDPDSVPENWLPTLNGEGLEAGTSTSSVVDTPIFMASTWSASDWKRRDVRYCSRCQRIKPPRCHHCSVCQRCVLKMDHHCVWVVNCVGAHNYKFFLLFLLFRHNKPSVLPDDYGIICLVFGLSLYLALSLLTFLIIHTSLLLSNTTTIEVAEKKKQIKWKYDMGKRNNFEQVFGTKKLLWLLPIYSEDLENVPALQGLSFPTMTDAEGL